MQGATPPPAATPAGSVAAAKPANASLTIRQPPADTTVSSSSVTVTVNYMGPTLVPAASATALDQHHLHYFLDVDATPYIGTTIPIPTSNPTIIHTADTQVTFNNVAPGTHQVAVVLGGSDHVSVNPPLVQQITFTVLLGQVGSYPSTISAQSRSAARRPVRTPVASSLAKPAHRQSRW